MRMRCKSWSYDTIRDVIQAEIILKSILRLSDSCKNKRVKKWPCVFLNIKMVLKKHTAQYVTALTNIRSWCVLNFPIPDPEVSNLKFKVKNKVEYKSVGHFLLQDPPIVSKNIFFFHLHTLWGQLYCQITTLHEKITVDYDGHTWTPVIYLHRFFTGIFFLIFHV